MAAGRAAGVGSTEPAVHRVRPAARGPHRQAHRTHAGVPQVGHDVTVGLAHRQRQRAADLGAQHLAHLGAVGNRLDRADHRLAHHLGPQRVAVVVGRAQVQQRAHVGVEFADLPLAGVGDFLREAVGRDVDLHLMVVHQRQRFPVRHQRIGCDGRPRGRHQRAGLACHIGVQRLVEGQREDRQLAVEFVLRAQQRITLDHAGGGQRRQPQAFHRVLGRRPGSHAHALDGAFQVGRQAGWQGLVHGAGWRIWPPAAPGRGA